MKTSKLIGPALVWAVATCEGEAVSVVVVDGEAQVWSNEDIYDNYNGQDCYTGRDGTPRFLRNGKPVGVWGNHMPSYLDWAQGGPIIEREKITTVCAKGDYSEKLCGYETYWVADKGHQCVDSVYGYLGDYLGASFQISEDCITGPSPLIAAMRCYVASKLGDEIEIPEELK